ncbi:nucleotidyltransferase family protein [Betaproteobacteria bacterium]|nr:nucleotidyltransferase family protein [Betaproteobacteria bacterium]
MAAGASRRFGDIKQLAKIDGVSMALRSYNILNNVLEGRTYLVLGANAEFIAREFQVANTIYNRQWSMGLGSSISYVATEMKNESNCSGVLITLGDQVKLNEHDYQKLVEVYDGENIVVSSYGDKKGPPVIFPRKYFKQLMHLKGDIGARELVRNNCNFVISCKLDNASFDIDFKDDFRNFLSQNPF